MAIQHLGRLIRKPDGSLEPKTYYIKLDDLGNVIVSETIWMRLQQAGWGDQFLILNEVKQPPAQRMEITLPPALTEIYGH